MKRTFRFIRVVIVVLSITFLSSCSHKEMFAKSIIVPGASGQVKVKKDQNNNYAINVTLKDLPPSKNLVPSKDTYVLWNESATRTTNIGQLVSSRSLFARGFKASLTAVSSDKPRRIFITAENDPKTQTPGTHVVLTTNDF